MRLFILLFAFTALSAIACPNLAGQYAVCRSTTGAVNGATDVIISQRIDNGVVIYTITTTDAETGERDTTEMAANGQIYTTNEPTPEGVITTTSSLSCAGEELNLVSSSTFAGEEFATVDVAMTRAGGALHQAFTGFVFGQPFEDILICE